MSIMWWGAAACSAGCGFGGTDIHAAIDLHGIGTDDFTVKPAGQANGEAGLARPGRTADNNQFGFG
jgi:hypothetical protein